MSVTTVVSDSTPEQTHTTLEFIKTGSNTISNVSYNDFCFIQTLDSKYEYIIKNVLEDYMYELNNLAIAVELTSDEKTTYKYNPKKMAYDIYGSTSLYHIILRLNNLCNVHEFDLSTSDYIKLLTRTDLAEALSSIYNSNSAMISAYNSAHENDTTETEITYYK